MHGGKILRISNYPFFDVHKILPNLTQNLVVDFYFSVFSPFEDTFDFGTHS